MMMMLLATGSASRTARTCVPDAMGLQLYLLLLLFMEKKEMKVFIPSRKFSRFIMFPEKNKLASEVIPFVRPGPAPPQGQQTPPAKKLANLLFQRSRQRSGFQKTNKNQVPMHVIQIMLQLVRPSNSTVLIDNAMIFLNVIFLETGLSTVYFNTVHLFQIRWYERRKKKLYVCSCHVCDTHANNFHNVMSNIYCTQQYSPNLVFTSSHT